MSDRILKLLSQETNLSTTPNAFGGAQLIRVRNSHASNGASVMVKDSGTITGSISIYPGEVLYIRKKSTETIETSAADTTIRAVVVAFGD